MSLLKKGLLRTRFGDQLAITCYADAPVKAGARAEINQESTQYASTQDTVTGLSGARRNMDSAMHPGGMEALRGQSAQGHGTPKGDATWQHARPLRPDVGGGSPRTEKPPDKSETSVGKNRLL